MASNSKAIASTALLLSLNLLFLTMVSSLSPAPVPAPAISAPLAPRPPTSTGGNPTPNPPPQAYCPIDVLKLGVCANFLDGFVNVTIGSPSTAPCCSFIGGLIDLEAAVCLCTAIRANVLGILELDIKVAVSMILNKCGRRNSSGFQCHP